MLSANLSRKEQLWHRAVSWRQHGFLVRNCFQNPRKFSAKNCHFLISTLIPREIWSVLRLDRRCWCFEERRPRHFWSNPNHQHLGQKNRRIDITARCTARGKNRSSFVKVITKTAWVFFDSWNHTYTGLQNWVCCISADLATSLKNWVTERAT